MQKVNPKDFTPEQFLNLRGKLLYAVFACRPDLALYAAQLLQRKTGEAASSDVRKVSCTVADIKENVPITVPQLYKESLTAVGYSDAGLANNADLMS